MHQVGLGRKKGKKRITKKSDYTQNKKGNAACSFRKEGGIRQGRVRKQKKGSKTNPRSEGKEETLGEEKGGLCRRGLSIREDNREAKVVSRDDTLCFAIRAEERGREKKPGRGNPYTVGLYRSQTTETRIQKVWRCRANGNGPRPSRV